jgi:elongation factor 3
MAPTKCNVPAAAKITPADVKSLAEEAAKKKDEDARKAAAEKIAELAGAASFAEEPYLIELLETAITLAGDNKSSNVRAAGDAAVDAIAPKLSEFAVRPALKAIFVGFQSQFWQSTMAALRVLDGFVARNRKAVAANLPEIIPELAQVMVHMRSEVKEASTASMAKVADCVGNLDIEPFIPTLIECINNVDEVPECVHKLAATTFVQQVESPTLSIMGPLLQRGLFFQQTTPIKRKSAVIIDNMCKLVEDPMDAAPFLPKLLPLLKRAMDEVADPECRQVCTRAYKTLLAAAGNEGGDEADTGKGVYNEETVSEQFIELLAESSGASNDDVTAFVRSEGVKVYFDYICSLSANALLAKNFDFDTWNKSCATSYLKLFFSEAETMTKSLVERAEAVYQASKKVFVVEDEEG